MERLVTMSKNDLSRYTVVGQALEKRMTQVKAAEMLGVSDRHFRRLLKAYKEQGAKGLLSKKRGKPSNRRLPAKLKAKTIKLMKTKYEGFGPTIGREKLKENDNITLTHVT